MQPQDKTSEPLRERERQFGHWLAGQAEQKGYEYPPHSWERGYWFSVQRGITALLEDMQ